MSAAVPRYNPTSCFCPLKTARGLYVDPTPFLSSYGSNAPQGHHQPLALTLTSPKSISYLTISLSSSAINYLLADLFSISHYILADFITALYLGGKTGFSRISKLDLPTTNVVDVYIKTMAC